MSTLPPTLTFSSTSWIDDTSGVFKSVRPTKVIDGALLSIAAMVAVIILVTAIVPRGPSASPWIAIPVSGRYFARRLQFH